MREADGTVRDAGGSPRAWLRACSGTLAAGLVVLAVGLLVGWGVAAALGAPGPGPAMLVGHWLAAVAGVALHRVGLRREDRWGVLAGLGAPALLLGLGMLFWWS